MDNTDKLPAIFDKYDAYLRIEIKTGTQDLTCAGTAMRYQFITNTGVSMNVDFSGSRGFTRFANDLARIYELYDEEYLRRKNPSLQAAWEEYQILLKLTK